MERLEFEDYEEFACDIADKFDNIDDEFGDVSIIAKYDDAKEIIRELLCLGYDVASIDIHREEFEEYYDEYRIALNQDGIWCEKFKRENGYFDDDASITYVMDNCSSVVFKHITSEEIYEVCVGKDESDEDPDKDVENKTEHSYMVNGKSVDKETFNEYVSQFAPDLVDEEDTKDEDESNDSNYSISIKVGLDTDEVEDIIRDMSRNLNRHVSDMFDMLYRPYFYEYRPHPIRFF